MPATLLLTHRFMLTHGIMLTHGFQNSAMPLTFLKEPASISGFAFLQDTFNFFVSWHLRT